MSLKRFFLIILFAILVVLVAMGVLFIRQSHKSFLNNIFNFNFFNNDLKKSNIVIATSTRTEDVPAIPVLKNQEDFKPLGSMVLKGNGFEPGFNFKMYSYNNKFPTDLTSQYGDTHYVGYLDLADDKVSTRVYSGKMMDKLDGLVNSSFKIQIKDCLNAKGDTEKYTVNIVVGTETLSGCASEAN
jgi:hypothetical protein